MSRENDPELRELIGEGLRPVRRSRPLPASDVTGGSSWAMRVMKGRVASGSRACA